MTKVEVFAEVKSAFPADNPSVRRLFALALWHEREGNEAKAEEYLDKAVQAESAS